MLRLLWVAAAIGAVGCAHSPLSGSDLDRVNRPAFISRIEEKAGPRSLVFQGDSSYGGKLKKLEPKEADRRLQVRLEKGLPEKGIPTISRFEVADQLRSTTLALLPKERPWLSVVDPAAVAASLESFLVEEVPANAPDYDLLRPLGVDAVIEFVVEDYGMRSDDGRAGTYVIGYGRMFMLDGGGNIWYRSFRADEVESGQPHLDPFKVNKDPNLFRDHMTQLLKAIAEQFAKDLQPEGRKGGMAPPESNDLSEGDVKTPKKARPKKEEADDLPNPD